MGLPLLVQRGARLVLGRKRESTVEYDYLAALEIRLYHLGDKVERTLVDGGGEDNCRRGKDRDTRGGEVVSGGRSGRQI